MIRKLEKWVWVGGALLAGNAGFVNAVGLLSYARQAVSHVTGITTLFSVAAARGELPEVASLGLVIVSFVSGAALGGFVVQNEALKLGRRYGVALFIECVLLIIAEQLMPSHAALGDCSASAACGLQNAMATTYSGAVLRTTHLSGMFTDVGAALGHSLRGLDVDWLRVRLHSIIIVSFLVGGASGTLLFSLFTYRTLYIPAALIGSVAVVYSIYAHSHRDRAAV
jgi:uncharacterized membrane protein YoaK (UPF0700 family)